jgi:plasmid maintenance system killer protein
MRYELTKDNAAQKNILTGNYRIIFRFENGNAHLLDYLDYH